MLALAVAGVLAFSPKSDAGLRRVRAQLESLERSAASKRYVSRELKYFWPTDAAIVEGLIPTISHPQVVEFVSKWMAANHVTHAVPALIKTFNRRFDATYPGMDRPAFDGLLAFGYAATPALLRFAKSGTPVERKGCADLLQEQCRYHPLDHRITALMGELARDPDPDLRWSAALGLWRIALHSHDWSMDDIHYFDLADLSAMQPICDLSCDGDRSVAIQTRELLWLLLHSVDRQIESIEKPGVDYVKMHELVVPLLNSKQPEVRVAATILVNSTLGIDGDRYRMLSDPNPVVVHAAVVASKVSIPPEWIPNLVKLSQSPNSLQRNAAAILLRASWRPEAALALAKLMKDPDPRVRAGAK